jgi:imidazoleglycerol-phosphate dehydratase
MFDLAIKAKGDLEVDCHHTVEDIGIVLGQAIAGAIGDGKGIARFSHTAVPMDESVAYVTLDCGGRAYLVMNGDLGEYPVSGIPGDLLEHFFHSLCSNAKITAHISFEGKNAHHKCEAVFKAFGVALRSATRIDPDRGIPSTKGLI